ncbi:hypothetical protein BDV93DRAFT_528404 [Ceratobasidium sp. AG-I]|nr:hypothetical protein BDV93DRAFT_528404 [Ceratobasidium sp. AG-I]
MSKTNSWPWREKVGRHVSCIAIGSLHVACCRSFRAQKSEPVLILQDGTEGRGSSRKDVACETGACVCMDQRVLRLDRNYSRLSVGSMETVLAIARERVTAQLTPMPQATCNRRLGYEGRTGGSRATTHLATCVMSRLLVVSFVLRSLCVMRRSRVGDLRWELEQGATIRPRTGH